MSTVDKPSKSTGLPALRTEAIYNPTKPFNRQIKEKIAITHPKEGPIIVSPFGKRFVVERQSWYWRGYSELTGQDGIGTKGLLHWKMGTMDRGAQDAFAMVADDLIEGGFTPVLMQDHIMMQTEDRERILKIVDALVELALINQWQLHDDRPRPIVISGGETAIINTLQGFEVGITGTGYVAKGDEISANIREGDAIIGIASNGAHSNGFSFFRNELLEKRGMQLSDQMDWGTTLGEELTRPTTVYLHGIKELLRDAQKRHGVSKRVIHGMVHITGGGLSKLRELLPGSKDLDIRINNDHTLRPQPIFAYSQKLGVSSEDMYTRFNNGIGYVVAVDKSYADAAIGVLRQQYAGGLENHRGLLAADRIGTVERGNGTVWVESAYEPLTVRF